MRTSVDVKTEILRDHDRIAQGIREGLEARGVAMFNIIGPPGSGKTTFLEALLGRLAAIPSLVIEGDVEGDIDARRLEARGIAALQINTHGGCHLDALMVRGALEKVPPGVRAVFVENVGNLICPAEWFLGETARILLVSVAEGSDKPYKYPLAFQTAGAIVVNKTDLAPHVDFDRDFFLKGATGCSRDAAVFFVSARTGEGMEEVAGWVRARAVRA